MTKIFNFRKYKLRYFDFKLVLMTLVLSTMGVLIVKSATMPSGGSDYMRQIMGIAIGIFCMLFIAMVDYHWVMKMMWLVYIANLGILLAVRFFGTTGPTNAQRWIDLPAIGRIQPSEFSKVATILFFAAFFQKYHEKINSPLTVFGSLILLAPPVFLIFDQPDLSTSMVVAFIFIVIIFTAKISYKWVLGVIGVCAPVVGYLVYYINKTAAAYFAGEITMNSIHYQIRRILAWLYPDFSRDMVLQQLNSVMAIGSGQLYGKGLFNESLQSVKNGQFLMEEDTDFIFAVVGEELGFAGSCILIALFTLLVLECLWLATRARDLSGRLICVGMASFIAFQAFVNIGVATMLLPNTGLPLPFISSGLSSLLSVFIGLGFVMNVGLQRKSEII